jgi:hypothetical protein
MKKFIFGLLILALCADALWLFGYFNMFEMSQLERQTYSIATNIKFMLSVALYISWRVTPEAKQ